MIDKDLIMMQLELTNSRLDKIDTQFSRIFEAQSEMNIVLTRNTITVEQHHRRSTLMEKIMARHHKRLDNLEKEITGMRSDLTSVSSELAPVKEHVTEVSKMVHVIFGLPPIVKFVAGLLTVITMGYGVLEIVKKIVTATSGVK